MKKRASLSILMVLFPALAVVIACGTSCFRLPPHTVPQPSVTASGSSGSPAGNILISDDDAIRKLGFSRGIVDLIRKETREPFYRLQGSDSDGNVTDSNGIVVKAGNADATALVDRMRPKYASMGYLVYITDIMGEDAKKITVVRGSDPYIILSLMNTNGINYDLDNKAVIQKLKAWEKQYPFEIMGASMDWVEIRFRSLPPDVYAFAKEVYAFCPDSVDQGAGSVEDLAGEIRKTSKLFLWWD